MAFRLVASISRPDAQKTDNPVGTFLSQHILGFMARFSEVVNDIWNQYSLIEKIRCIRGLEEMIKIGKKVTRLARPQVCFVTSLDCFKTHLCEIDMCLFTIGFGSKGASV